MTRIAVPAPISCGIFLSYKCNCRCRYYMYACSPDWNSDWISEGELATILKQLSDKINPSPYGFDRVSFDYSLAKEGFEELAPREFYSHLE